MFGCYPWCDDTYVGIWPSHPRTRAQRRAAPQPTAPSHRWRWPSKTATPTPRRQRQRQVAAPGPRARAAAVNSAAAVHRVAAAAASFLQHHRRLGRHQTKLHSRAKRGQPHAAPPGKPTAAEKDECGTEWRRRLALPRASAVKDGNVLSCAPVAGANSSSGRGTHPRHPRLRSFQRRQLPRHLARAKARRCTEEERAADPQGCRSKKGGGGQRREWPAASSAVHLDLAAGACWLRTAA